MRNGWMGRAWLVVLAVLCTGCATVDFDHPKTFSTAIEPPADTYLGRKVAQVPPMDPGVSGFHLLDDGIEALAARLVLAERAERTLDAQYYLVHPDLTGDLFIHELLNAADRGVRVRLLLDDVFTKGAGDRLWTLNNHPNFEVRIFNPFATRAFRYLRSAFSLRRVNRRMHNKSYTVDNWFTVIGGRNIGDEYFNASEEVNFGDLDLLCLGPVVEEVSTMFDSYWNNRLSVPIDALVSAPRDPQRQERELRKEYAKALVHVTKTKYASAVDDSVQSLLETQADDLLYSHYELVYDPPAKAGTNWTMEDASILDPLRQAIAETQHEFLLVSPYFVPRAKGVEGFGRLRERDVDVTVITNSLGANNHAVVHSGYAPSRAPLLDLGVKLYEVRPDSGVTGAERGGNEHARATLHTKAFVLDRSRIFIGSFNWDPRSAYINTEMGIILDSPEIAGALVDRAESRMAEGAYRLERDENGALLWYTVEDGEEVVYYSEPGASCWAKLTAGLMSLLPIKGQL